MYLYLLVWINGCILGVLAGIIIGYIIAKRMGSISSSISSMIPPRVYVENACVFLHDGLKGMHEYYLEHQEEIDSDIHEVAETISPVLSGFKFLYQTCKGK